MNHAARTVFALAPVLLAQVAQAQDVQSAIDDAFALQAEGGTLADVREALIPHAGDDAVAFAIGAVEFLSAGENLTQEAYRLGFLGTMRQFAAMMQDDAGPLEWIGNDEPAEVSMADVRRTFDRFVSDLAEAEESLGVVDGDFKCVINIDAIRFDVNADGKTTERESLRTLFAMLPAQGSWNEETEKWEEHDLVPPGLVLAFDRGDTSWLRGYCQVLMGAGEWALAHDWDEHFQRTGHVFFPRAQTEYGFLRSSGFAMEMFMGGDPGAPFDVTDLLVFFGNLRLPVAEPERMGAALGHFRAAVGHGKDMWGHYDREEDDDREWVPNPRQTAAFGDVQIDEDMRETWLMFLDETDDLLAGRKVLRFWRGDGTHGIDLPKVFEEPREFDLLYWIQGSAAGPYLREGEFTEPGTWQRLRSAFDFRVFRYMFWFN